MTLDDITPSRDGMARLSWLWTSLSVLCVAYGDALLGLLWIGLALLGRGVVDLRDMTDLGEGSPR